MHSARSWLSFSDGDSEAWLGRPLTLFFEACARGLAVIGFAEVVFLRRFLASLKIHFSIELLLQLPGVPFVTLLLHLLEERWIHLAVVNSFANQPFLSDRQHALCLASFASSSSSSSHASLICDLSEEFKAFIALLPFRVILLNLISGRRLGLKMVQQILIEPMDVHLQHCVRVQYPAVQGWLLGRWRMVVDSVEPVLVLRFGHLVIGGVDGRPRQRLDQQVVQLH